MVLYYFIFIIMKSGIIKSALNPSLAKGMLSALIYSLYRFHEAHVFTVCLREDSFAAEWVSAVP